MTKEQLKNFKYQPPPTPNPVVTPGKTYLIASDRDENDMWERLEKALEGWEVIDFRPPLSTDEAFLTYGSRESVYESKKDGAYVDNIPRFIVKKKRVFTDTERLNYIMRCNKVRLEWGQSREQIDRVLRSRLAANLPIDF